MLIWLSTKDHLEANWYSKITGRRIYVLQMYKSSAENQMEKLDADTANKVSKIQLTRTEFADSLGLKPTSMFVRNMFLMVDKDKNGLVSFHEFVELFTILAKGRTKYMNHLLTFLLKLL